MPFNLKLDRTNWKLVSYRIPPGFSVWWRIAFNNYFAFMLSARCNDRINCCMVSGRDRCDNHNREHHSVLSNSLPAEWVTAERPFLSYSSCSKYIFSYQQVYATIYCNRNGIRRLTSENIRRWGRVVDSWLLIVAVCTTGFPPFLKPYALLQHMLHIDTV